jgi:hypothetical protein
MAAQTFCRFAGTLFGIVALAHVWRIATGAPVTIGAMSVPMAVSWIGALVTAALAVWGWRSARGG